MLVNAKTYAFMLMQVGIVAVASDVKYPTLDRCALDRLMPLSNRTRLYLNGFIDGLEKESCKRLYVLYVV